MLREHVTIQFPHAFASILACALWNMWQKVWFIFPLLFPFLVLSIIMSPDCRGEVELTAHPTSDREAAELLQQEGRGRWTRITEADEMSACERRGVTASKQPV